MGYDIHIVRTREWYDAKERPITKAEVAKVIAGDRELSWSSTDYSEVKASNGTIERNYAIVWRGKSFCDWDQFEIVAKNPSEEQIMKMVSMARALNAIVVGDDGEIYRVRTGLLGGKKLVVEGEK